MISEEVPDGVFYCTEMTPWQPGLTEPGTPIVHTERAVPPRQWLSWGRFEQQMRCTVCGTTWTAPN